MTSPVTFFITQPIANTRDPATIHAVTFSSGGLYLPAAAQVSSTGIDAPR